MPTDGQDFPKRKKCYGTTYSLARDGAPMSDVAEHLVAGVARDLSSNPVPWLRQGIECIIDHSQSLLSYGRATGLPEKQLLEKLGLLQNQFTDEWNAFSAQILAA